MTNGGLLSLYAVAYGGAANADVKMAIKSPNVIGKVVSNAILYSSINSLHNQVNEVIGTAAHE